MLAKEIANSPMIVTKRQHKPARLKEIWEMHKGNGEVENKVKFQNHFSPKAICRYKNAF